LAEELGAKMGNPPRQKPKEFNPQLLDQAATAVATATTNMHTVAAAYGIRRLLLTWILRCQLRPLATAVLLSHKHKQQELKQQQLQQQQRPTQHSLIVLTNQLAKVLNQISSSSSTPQLQQQQQYLQQQLQKKIMQLQLPKPKKSTLQPPKNDDGDEWIEVKKTTKKTKVTISLSSLFIFN
jgi:tRNA/tmRNA/rRNA uracil-C5-methylase (TrmA/RlmC/RlmD family)